MNTITLHFTDKITEKLRDVLSKFSAEDLQMEEVDAEFLEAKKELQKDYDYSQQEDAVFYTLEEVKAKYNISSKD
ncbi:hypothetical protein [Halpernia sp.]|uniref:hypothetical protein n=1 Tax=Halpernia sp. TaxID=2782209 RepID=UPI003A93C470